MELVPFYSGSKSKCSKAFHGRSLLPEQDQGKLYVCSKCKGLSKLALYCDICDMVDCGSCGSYEPEIIHPFHLSHPLTFTVDRNLLSNDESFSSEPEGDRNLLTDDESFSLEPEGDSNLLSDDESFSSKPEARLGSYAICNCCRRHLESRYYHCSICNYNINADCAEVALNLTIVHPKSHEHTLTLFAGRFPYPCNACGKSLDDAKDHVYTCQPCSYMVHKTCIYLPRVIKITRHQHRLSHSSFLPPGEFACGVCRQTVDISYGEYSCQKGCHYAVHSKCATREDVWDGIDLEGVPEEPEEDVEPFVRIDEETIQHFSHEHHLKLHQDYTPSGNQYMLCQICALPIVTSASFYSCTQCDFVMEEACASLPRKKDHLLHKHPLLLLPLYPRNPYDGPGLFECKGCDRYSCGFVYVCTVENCKFQLDTRCASLPDPFIHDSHLPDHPLFFNLVDRYESYGECMVCTGSPGDCIPQCMECKFKLCIRCATIPRVAHYKHDRHPLTICFEKKETTDNQYWCEICESKLGGRVFYTCDECSVTVHLSCLLGKEIYMKPGHVRTNDQLEIEIVLNGCTRPFCDGCGRRCRYPMVFKSKEFEYIWCSLNCFVQ